MSFLRTPYIKFTAINTNGLPLSGGKVYTYIAGTNTPTNTWSDFGNTLNSNPIILNSMGQANIFLTENIGYKYVIKDALDNTIDTQDNIVAMMGQGGGGGTLTIQNIGTGEGVFASMVGATAQLKSLIGINGTQVTSTADQIQISSNSTTAGLLNRVYFLGDETIVNGVDYYALSAVDKGLLSVEQTVTCDDGQQFFFAQDFISDPYDSAGVIKSGQYNAIFTAKVNSQNGEQSYEAEVYLCDNLGNPIASGVSGAPIGDLGVQVIGVLDSGVVDMQADTITQIHLNANVASDVTHTIGQRIRFHVSAKKVGTTGANVVLSLFSGLNYDSYVDVPVSITTDMVTDSRNGQILTNSLNGLIAKDGTTPTTASIPFAQGLSVGFSGAGGAKEILFANNGQTISESAYGLNFGGSSPVTGQAYNFQHANGIGAQFIRSTGSIVGRDFNASSFYGFTSAFGGYGTAFQVKNQANKLTIVGEYAKSNIQFYDYGTSAPSLSNGAMSFWGYNGTSSKEVFRLEGEKLRLVLSTIPNAVGDFFLKSDAFGYVSYTATLPNPFNQSLNSGDAVTFAGITNTGNFVNSGNATVGGVVITGGGLTRTGGATDDVVASRVTGDAFDRFVLDADGGHLWGNGTVAPTKLMEFLSGNIKFSTTVEASGYKVGAGTNQNFILDGGGVSAINLYPTLAGTNTFTSNVIFGGGGVGVTRSLQVQSDTTQGFFNAFGNGASGDLSFGTTSNHAVYLRTNGVTRATFDTSGNTTLSGGLTLPVGTATLAPLNIGAFGVTKTTPVDGDVWKSTSNTLSIRMGIYTRTIPFLERINTFTAAQTINSTLTTNSTITCRQIATTCQTSATSTGAIAWALGSGGQMDLTTALTGAITMNITNSTAGGWSALFLTQGATIQNVTLSLTGVSWIVTGANGLTGTNTITLPSTSFLANKSYCIQLYWSTPTRCFVAVNTDSTEGNTSGFAITSGTVTCDCAVASTYYTTAGALTGATTISIINAYQGAVMEFVFLQGATNHQIILTSPSGSYTILGSAISGVTAPYNIPSSYTPVSVFTKITVKFITSTTALISFN